jgi:choline transport protein
VTFLYGIILASVVYLCVAVSLGELASVYPTAGGQYHFTYLLAPESVKRGLPYTCGVASTCSWIFLTAAVQILFAQALLALPASLVDGYMPKTCHYFLVFESMNAVSLAYNILLLQRTPWIHNLGCELSYVMDTPCLPPPSPSSLQHHCP